MAKTLVYQIYLFCYLGFEKEGSPLVVARKRLKYVSKICATHVWIGPIFVSPWEDHGYDISDHFNINPRFGTMEEFNEFVVEAHRLGLKVVIDLVPNHMSVKHELFTNPETRKDFFCLSKEDHPGQKNCFDGGSAWHHDEETGEYSLSLFTAGQRDLCWFPNGAKGDINEKIVGFFQKVIDFWTLDCGVDGFRIDVPQSINKDFDFEEWDFNEMLDGDLSIRVLNALFGGSSRDLFLMVELFDPTMGDLVKRYLAETPVNFVLNVLLKDEITLENASSVETRRRFTQLIKRQSKIPGLMLDFESHDSRRFPSRGISPQQSIRWLFENNPSGVCLYNGEEFGLDNPTEEQLPKDLLLELDAVSKMRFSHGEPIEKLRPCSRANARIPLPDEKEYEQQFESEDSLVNLIRSCAEHWEKLPE